MRCKLFVLTFNMINEEDDIISRYFKVLFGATDTIRIG